MLYDKLEKELIIKGYSNILAKNYSIEGEYLIRSKYDFSILAKKNLEAKRLAIHFFYDKVILSDLKEYHVEVNFKLNTFIEQSGEFYEITTIDELILKYSPSQKKFFVSNSSNEHFYFNKNTNLEIKIYKTLFLEYILNQSNNSFIRAKDLQTGIQVWQLDFDHKIIRCEQAGQYLVLEYQSLDTYTIVIDLESKQECWRRRMKYGKIDKDRNIVFFGSDKIIGVELCTGKVLMEVLVSLQSPLGYFPHFMDTEGIYYTTYNGSFGKANSTNGEIIWEFSLIDEKEKKRKLSNWILLGNGNLFLQSMPNHINGDLSCLFNPKNNLDHSLVKDNIRVNQ